MGFEWLALLMFVLFFVLILSGYPVAFSFAGTAVVFLLLGIALGAFDWRLLRLLTNRWFGTMSDFTLLAIIYFVFMGAIFEKSGVGRTTARDDRYVDGADAWRSGAGRCPRGNVAGRRDRCRCGDGDCDGHDFVADHVALWL